VSVPVNIKGSIHKFDPYKLLDDLLPHLNNLNIPLIVSITDNVTSVNYNLAQFLSKDYSITDNHIHFGGVLINKTNAHISIHYECDVVP
jgi:hypothetical protein